MEFPIRRKLLFLITGLVIVAMGIYLLLAVHLFREDKTSLIYEMNASTVRTLAAETESALLKVADKVKLLTQGHQDANWIRAIFEAEPDLVSYALYQPTADPAKWLVVSSVRNPEYLKLYNLPVSAVERIREKVPVPFGRVLGKGVWVANATVPGGAPVLTVALAVEIRGEGDANRGSNYVAVADVRLDRILKLVGGRGIATAYIVDPEARVIAHPDAELVSSRAVLSDNPIVRDAISSQLAFEMKRFDWKDGKWLGAYASVGLGGLKVISQVEEAQAFRAAYRLVEKSVLFGLIVVTAALLVSALVAQGFTRPIQRLVAATERISRGEFGESVHVDTRDEIGHLARAFNAMASDLQNQHAQLESNRSELEMKVKERTAALEAQKKQVVDAQEALVRTTRLASLGELAGAAAHEILNPLNNMGIRLQRMQSTAKQAESGDLKLEGEIVGAWRKAFENGGWDALGKEVLTPSKADPSKTLAQEDLENLAAIWNDHLKRFGERAEDLGFLSKEITRVTRIINSMRSLSRVGGERRPLDIHLPLDETVLMVSDHFEKRKISLVKEYSADSRENFAVVADKDELVQVFSNLLRNSMQAVSAANRRAGTVRISTRQNAGRVEVRIIDNGTGIKKDHLPNLFEANFTTKTIDEGTGLGLSISRRLVRAFGGDIDVENTQEGTGTTFLIWFPKPT